ncbi:MAG: hypothetical protein J7M29_09605 [Verrucomicrobia bacterium]|nr:hypothetical protein [Verrucomicrobiota bacterium]
MPLALVLVFALTRIPGVMPPNFSAAYGLLFCGAVYLTGAAAWWLPLAAMAVTDLGLCAYYTWSGGVNAFQPYLLVNYLGYGVIVALGRRFKPQSSWLWLLSGGILGAILFYLITNTAAWFFNPFHNPEYTKDFAGWLTALTKGTAGYPPTWEFFRNTLLSGGLFTGLFAGAMKLAAALEPEEETEEEGEGADEAEPAQEAEAPAGP